MLLGVIGAWGSVPVTAQLPVPPSGFGMTMIAKPVYGPPQNLTANPFQTWRAFSGITSFTHPASGREYAVGCASDGILIVDVTSVDAGFSFGQPAASKPAWWWIDEPSPQMSWCGDPRPAAAAYPNGRLLSTDTRNREAVAYVAQGGRVFLYSVNFLHDGLWVLELPAVWPPPNQTMLPSYSAWHFLPAALPGYPGMIPGGGHTISLDRAHAQVYVCGIQGSVPDYSLPSPGYGNFYFSSTMSVYVINPTNPTSLTFLDQYHAGGGPNGTHDVQILGPSCVVSGTTPAGTVPPHFAVISIANGWQGSVPSKVLPAVTLPHSAWFDGQWLWGLEENNAVNIRVWDTVLPNPVATLIPRVPTPQSGQPPYHTVATVHHLRVVGRTGFFPHYQDGIQIVDVPNGVPGNPPEVLANLDTTYLEAPVPIYPPNWFEVTFQGIWDVAVEHDSGLISATQVGSPLGEDAGVLVVRADIAQLNRYWAATPFPPSMPVPQPGDGWAPRIVAPNGPPRQGRPFVVADENWARYSGNAFGVCYFSLTPPQSPQLDPSTGLFQWNIPFAGIVIPANLVAGQCTTPIPSGWTGVPIYAQIIVQDGPNRFAASRGTRFGIGG